MLAKHIIPLSMTAILITGCSSTKDISQAMGSTGTGAIVGALSGAGAGYGCKAAGGSTALCVTAGLAAGAAMGALAATLDEQWASTVPVIDCKGVSKKLGFSPSSANPIMASSNITFDNPKGVYKAGSTIKPTLNIQLAAADGPEIGVKLVDKLNKKESNLLKKKCGGYSFPLDEITPEKEGPIKIQYDVVDEKGKTLTSALGCASVSNSGKINCI